MPSKYELELQFAEDDTNDRKTENVVSMVFHIPPGEERDLTSCPAYKIHQMILEKAGITRETGNAIVSLDESFCYFMTPRGRYDVEMYEHYLRMHGKTYDYKIMYKNIHSFYLLPEDDGRHVSYVISLLVPIRQGNQQYNNLVMQFTRENRVIVLNLTDEELSTKYPKLSHNMTGEVHTIVGKLTKHITSKKVYVPGAFKNSEGASCIRCAYGSNGGLLYLFETCFIFIHKPPIFIRFDDVSSVQYQRYSNRGGPQTFDIQITAREVGTLQPKIFLFAGIARKEYKKVNDFLLEKGLKITKSTDEELQADSGEEDDNGMEEEDDEEDSDFNDKKGDDEKDDGEGSESSSAEDESEEEKLIDDSKE